MFFAEHTYIPVSRDSPWPEGPSGTGSFPTSLWTVATSARPRRRATPAGAGRRGGGGAWPSACRAPPRARWPASRSTRCGPLAKLSRVMPLALRRRVEAVRTMTDAPAWGDAGSAVDPAALVVVAQACRDTERVRFGYTSAAGERRPARLAQLPVGPVGPADDDAGLRRRGVHRARAPGDARAPAGLRTALHPDRDR